MMPGRRQSGFSLIELLVAATVFTFVVVGVSQLFARALDLQRRAASYQKIQENALFVLESIAREVRVSAVISGNTDCVGAFADADKLVINHPDHGEVAYRFAKAADGRGYITRRAAAGGAGDEIISTNDVNITRMAFCVNGAGVDGEQARVTIPITLQAVSARASARVVVSLQTTVASRDLLEELTN